MASGTRRAAALAAALLLATGCAAATPEAPRPAAAAAPRVVAAPLAGRWRVIAGEVGDPQWSGHLSDVVGVAVDPSGILYATDSRNGLVQVMSADGRLLARWGASCCGARRLDSPAGVALDRA